MTCFIQTIASYNSTTLYLDSTHSLTHSTLQLLKIFISKDEQVCNTVEKLFHGDRVLFILDCCASGNLCHYLPSSSSTSSSTTATATKMTTSTSTSTSNCNNSGTRNNSTNKTKQYLLLASR